MERGAPSELLQSLPPQGLPSPYSQHGDSRSETSPQDQSLAHHYTQSEARQSHYATATPTSEYSTYPASARSGSFPEHQLQRAFQPSAASMASHSSSLNLQDGADAAHQDPHEDPQQLKSDPDVPIDPSITAQSPTQYYPQTSPYGTAGDMQHYGHPSAVYSQPQPRPDWSGYGAHTPITPNHHGVFQHQQTTPTAARGGHGNQVFSFVPIPGSQQHKRPRRRYEEIERMYKCGWNGCEKAYGTLNHLNAHVTMQSHGQKRVPEEFKEIRKEWKARKKAEEQARKHQDEQARSDGQPTPSDPQATHDSQQGSVASYGGAHAQRLPPLGYNPNNYPTAPQFSSGAGEYTTNYITAPSGFPSSPYAQSHQQVYGQANGGQTH